MLTGPENPSNPRRSSPSKKSSAASDAEKSEALLARHLAEDNFASFYDTCAILRDSAGRTLEIEKLKQHAAPLLIRGVVTNEHPLLRRSALEALAAIDSDLGTGGRYFLANLELHLERRRGASYAAQGHVAAPEMPYAEQLLIAARWIIEAIYLGRGYPDQPLRRINSAFAQAALKDNFGQKQIITSNDALACARATLPKDLNETQENLDTLASLKLIPHPAALFSKDRARPTGKIERPSKAHIAERTNHLLRVLAAEESYDIAGLIIAELARTADRPAIQAIRQASFGLMSDSGEVVAFRDDAHRAAFRQSCNDAIRQIEARTAAK